MGIAAGAWLTITGSNLANSSRTWQPAEIVNGALPTRLDGVSVTIDGNPAYVSSIDPNSLLILWFDIWTLFGSITWVQMTFGVFAFLLIGGMLDMMD